MKKSRAFFYPRLALSNMRKNSSIYLPYLLAGVFLSGLFYMILAVGEMAVVSGMKGAMEMKFILDMCAALCVGIMLLVLFYINSFVMKRRKRELGLYCILGMEKRHLCILLFWEVFLAAAISIGGGILFGALFSQFLFLVLLRLLHIPALLTFMIPLSSVCTMAWVFGIGYLVLLCYDWLVIAKTKPIALLKSRQEGEREPKTKALTAFLGAAFLTGGYGLALWVKTASDGLTAFFPAAFLVMIGTLCLFQAGSIVFLKWLRRQKNFYYRPENFIAVSGMMYRMKQNAAGLAAIAILSTALLVVLSSSVTLYCGEEGKLGEMFPREYRLWMKPDALNGERDIQTGVEDAPIGIKDAQKDAPVQESTPAKTAAELEKTVSQSLEALAKEHQVRITDVCSLQCAWWMAVRQENHFDENVLTANSKNFAAYCSMTLLPLADYNEMTGQDKTLAADEILLISPYQEQQKAITINQKSLRIKEQVKKPKDLPHMVLNQDMFPRYVAVVADMDVLQSLLGETKDAQSVESYVMFDLEGEQADCRRFDGAVTGLSFPSGTLRFEKKSDYRDEFYLLYGSILFIGLLFTCLFLLVTVLIVYYKQVTEGYDDRERFGILEKVGMQDTEIRAVINKQVLLVFFLPLVTAIVHICVAARVLRLMLTMLGLSNQGLFWGCIAVCCAVFSVAYFAVYRLTSRAYYRIVHGR